jgi:acyl carrier protein
MSTIDRLRRILRDALQLGARADALREDSPLIGSIPEFDSMAVVTVITMIEEDFGITVDDDEMSAEVFETLGSLNRFVSAKTNA